ncbi:hypothetical protein NM688_g1561 [Phlebia brevispora]|uniref:Uncharacterized protein n=1 Tax=Phlebia brevispora TaxID=194682 RepID=A0ACC1TB02_9APHY|nr:hypothetical protein NM688_g1561 [Phlebia brevispora]
MVAARAVYFDERAGDSAVCGSAGRVADWYLRARGVTQLYKGPGLKLLSFMPTVLFVALVRKVLSIYHTYAVCFTNWESHTHQSTHDASLTIKTFSLSALVAYGPLALSAFVYVPFGEDVMMWTQLALFHCDSPMRNPAKTWVTTVLSMFAAMPMISGAGEKRDLAGEEAHQLWEMDHASARVVNNFVEVGLPYVMRAVEAFQAGKGLKLTGCDTDAGADAKGKEKENSTATTTGTADANTSMKKQVQLEDEASGSTPAKSVEVKEEREFMNRVCSKVALPEYMLFADYSEMVTQFRYVALWSTIWPLAPGEWHPIHMLSK